MWNDTNIYIIKNFSDYTKCLVGNRSHKYCWWEAMLPFHQYNINLCTLKPYKTWGMFNRDKYDALKSHADIRTQLWGYRQVMIQRDVTRTQKVWKILIGLIAFNKLDVNPRLTLREIDNWYHLFYIHYYLLYTWNNPQYVFCFKWELAPESVKKQNSKTYCVFNHGNLIEGKDKDFVL